jgi:hypothetical protein
MRRQNRQPDISIDHLFLKALDEAGVQFPSSKSEIISRLGDFELKLSGSHIIKASSLVSAIEPDNFENGAAFFCAYHSALYRDTWKIAFLKDRVPN